MDTLTLNNLSFTPLPGIGEYVDGAHWIDLPLCERVQDVFTVFLKVLAASSLIGFSSFLIHPVVSIAVVIGAVALIAGIAFIALSLYRIHLCCSQTPFVYSKEVPELGSWTDNSVFIAEDANMAISLKFELLQKAERSIEISGCYCGGPLFDQALEIIRSRFEVCPTLEVNIISNPDLLTEANWERIHTLVKLYPNRFFFLGLLKSGINFQNSLQ